jgi:hypothetical protein
MCNRRHWLAHDIARVLRISINELFVFDEEKMDKRRRRCEMPKKHTSRHIGLTFSLSLTSFLLDTFGFHNAIYDMLIGNVRFALPRSSLQTCTCG